MKKKVLIIGNSVAAVAAVKGLRENGFDGAVTILSDEKHAAYSRPMIAELLSGHAGIEQMTYQGADFYQANQVELLTGVKAHGVDVNSRKVKAGDKIFDYDYLIIATGGTPFRPPVKNMDAEGVFTFINISDALRIKEYLPAPAPVVVIGGGLIGMKAAESLLALGMDVTVVELAPHILSTVVDMDGAGIIQDNIKRKGMRLFTGMSADSIKVSGGRATAVVLSNGTELEARAVILATGVVPNKKIVEGCGLNEGRGIIVNDFMQTSAPCVYAAGDVAEAMDTFMKIKRPIPIWPVAYRHGYAAGSHIAGKKIQLKNCFSMNSIVLCDTVLISAGHTSTAVNPGDKVLSRLDKETGTYKRCVVRGGVLAGYVLVNDVDRAGLMTGFIESQEEVGGFINSFIEDQPNVASVTAAWRSRNLLRVPTFAAVHE